MISRSRLARSSFSSSEDPSSAPAPAPLPGFVIDPESLPFSPSCVFPHKQVQEQWSLFLNGDPCFTMGMPRPFHAAFHRSVFRGVV